MKYIKNTQTEILKMEVIAFKMKRTWDENWGRLDIADKKYQWTQYSNRTHLKRNTEGKGRKETENEANKQGEKTEKREEKCV